jgi:UDP-3-O-[3-hydroxymyristoyl] glucosamine N-acyltransferase
MPVALGELAARFGCELRGDPDLTVDRVATLSGAAQGAVSFLANSRYRRDLEVTRATAVILRESDAAACPAAVLLAANPYATYARVAAFLHPSPAAAHGVHPRACIDPTAQLAADASVAAGAIIGAGVVLGPRVQVGPGCVLLDGVRVGDDTRLVANVTLCEGVSIGARCLLHPGAVIGADGFGHAPDADGYVKVPQLGSVRIGDDVEVGACTTIDRGAIDDTLIEDGVKLDNHVQIGHNCRIGAHTVVAGCAGVSGSTTIGRRCMIGGMAGIGGHIEIVDDVIIGGKAMVTSSIHKPGMYLGSLGADEAKRFRRNAARFQRLDEFVRRVTVERRGKQGEGGDE